MSRFPVTVTRTRVLHHIRSIEFGTPELGAYDLLLRQAADWIDKHPGGLVTTLNFFQDFNEPWTLLTMHVEY